MADFISTAALILILVTCGSVVYDIFTYEDRQTKWERAHPGSTYIRGYRKFEKASARAEKAKGQV